MSQIPLLIAFLAGLVSFLAPCVLPLIPGYLAYLARTSLDQSSTNRWKIFSNALSFVLGFGLVFAILGVLLNTVLETVAFDVQVWLARVGGLVVIAFGLYLTGIIKIPFLEKERRVVVNLASFPKLVSSFVFGAAFAAGWTPCVGAVLGSILGLATTQPGVAFWLLISYSLGFGLPFLLVGLFAAQASSLIVKIGPTLKYVNLIFGILLIGFGVLIFTQNLVKIANFELLQNLFGR